MADVAADDVVLVGGVHSYVNCGRRWSHEDAKRAQPPMTMMLLLTTTMTATTELISSRDGGCSEVNWC